jgi:hypothetical protein
MHATRFASICLAFAAPAFAQCPPTPPPQTLASRDPFAAMFLSAAT